LAMSVRRVLWRKSAGFASVAEGVNFFTTGSTG